MVRRVRETMTASFDIQNSAFGTSPPRARPPFARQTL